MANLNEPLPWTAAQVMAVLHRELQELNARLDERHATQNRNVDNAFNAAKEAIGEAKKTADKRFDELAKQITLIMSRLDLSQGRYIAVAGFAATFGGLVVALISRTFT